MYSQTVIAAAYHFMHEYAHLIGLAHHQTVLHKPYTEEQIQEKYGNNPTVKLGEDNIERHLVNGEWIIDEEHDGVHGNKGGAASYAKERAVDPLEVKMMVEEILSHANNKGTYDSFYIQAEHKKNRKKFLKNKDAEFLIKSN